MKDTIFFISVISTLALGLPDVASAQEAPPRVVLVVHGGAGSISPENTPESRQQEVSDKLEEALMAGYHVLDEGGTSLDAVVAAVTIMEDSPIFNAGRGAVLTSAGTVELDASIMDGASRSAGGVAGVKRVKSPIALARAVMEQTDHVLLAGEGAEAFAAEIGMEMVDNEYFRTDRRVEQFESRKARLNDDTGDARILQSVRESGHYGTVGAAALDSEGNLAAATSTGGLSFKKWGRIGDSPIIGAGTYADNETCAISATGTGEYFIRGVLSFRISALMQHAGLSLEDAASSAIHGTLSEMGGDGGVIGLDRDGNVTMTFNTDGMYRGYVDAAGNTHVAMFGK